MKTGRTAILVRGALVAVVLHVAAYAYADITINYSVSGVGPTSYPGPVTPASDAEWGANGYPGDTVELGAYSGTLTLTPGTSVHEINTLLWYVDHTYGGTGLPLQDDEDHWTDLLFNINASRSITLDGSTGTLNQQGQLGVTWYTDTLSFATGATTSLIVDGYRVDITPLPFTPTDAGDLGPQFDPAATIWAQFDVAAVPEPGAIVAWSILGTLGLAMTGWRRVRKS